MSRLLITIFGGWFGLHKFVYGEVKLGFVYLFTCGLCGIGWLVDIIIAITKLSKPRHGKTDYVINEFYNNNTFNVVGTYYRHDNICNILSTKKYGKSKYVYSPLEDYAVLVPEPTNQHDPNAIKVMVREEHIGYVPRQLTSIIRPLIDNHNFVCKIVKGDYLDGEYKVKEDFECTVRIEGQL